MTRSEEELPVGTTQRERGRVRRRTYLVTDHIEQAVPVRRERVRVEREPSTDATRDAATSGPAVSAAEQEVVLGAQEPVVKSGSSPQSGSGSTRTP
jgi:stress response protein YsnF